MSLLVCKMYVFVVMEGAQSQQFVVINISVKVMVVMHVCNKGAAQ